MIYRFGDCELDTRACELRLAGQVRHVEPQVFDVLVHLLEHRDRLVTKEELLDRVWGRRFVTPGTLNSRLKAARQAVGDDGRAQQVIRTVHGRGFRFVAPVALMDGAAEAPAAPVPALAPPVGPSPLAPAASPVASPEASGSPAATAEPPEPIARSAELDRLAGLLDAARAGTRQLAFVTGEPGIGKSTLADVFLSRAPADVWVARGQCLEQRGAGEPYLPVLDALGRLCRGAGGAEVIRHLERCAPIWLSQMPSLLRPDQLESVQRRAMGANRERMLREIVEALESLTREMPLVLLVEDLHWSDPSTLDLIAWLAQRAEPARLLVIGTLRPSDAAPQLRAAIAQARRSGRCSEIPLQRWSESDVRDYCRRRYPARPLPDELLALVHQRSEGNPLFVQMLLDGWVESGALAEGPEDWILTRPVEEIATTIPETLRTLVEQRIERLPSDHHRVLEAGSVVGTEFAAALVAAALEMDPEVVETHCASLVRQGRLLRGAGQEEWRDGTWTARFAFTHHLFQHALYDVIPPSRRARLHRRIGERLEAAHAAAPADPASELALHFRLGRDHARAVVHLRHSAEQALRRSAHREAIGHITLALDLLRRHPDVPDALRAELELQRMLGPALLLTRGWGDPEAERAYRRARELSEQLDDAHQLAQVLYGMAYLHEIRGDFHESEPLLEEVIGLRERAPGPYTTVESHELLSCSLFHQGKFASALSSARAAIETRGRLDQGDPFAASLGMNASLACQYWAGLALWCLGHPDQALQPLQAALRMAEESQLIYMLATSHTEAAQLFHFRREMAPLVVHADAALRISERQGYPFQHAIALTLRGWAAVAEGDDEGLEQIRRGIAMQSAVGADMERPYGLGLLAEALLRLDRVEEGLVVVDDALALISRRARTFFWEAELLRLRGELLLRRGEVDAAELSLRQALEVASRQEARSLELRAATSLCRLEEGRGRPGRRTAARKRLAAILGRFTEGLETPDLRDAAALLA